MKNKKYKLRKNCLCCNNNRLNEIINLGLHSFADRFIPLKLKFKLDPIYPLILDMCKNCSFIQSRVITNPKDRYLSFDYSYTSSNSLYAKTHWQEFATSIDKKIGIKNKKIIEIGSNDGYLSSILKNNGADILAVDASSFMTKVSKKKKLNALNLIFSFKESKIIKKKFGEADIIIANNVFNHSNNPNNFLKGVNNLLKKNGHFIFEQPNFAKGLEAKKFDQIYHEHISYFTSKNINSILNCNNFKINNISSNDYHGGSLRTISVKDKSNLETFDISKFIQKEEKKNIYKISYYKKLNKFFVKEKNNLKKKINRYIKMGYVVCGVGAGAKSNTFLTFNQLDNTKINFITDNSKYKINKLTPLTRIIIKSDLEINKYKKIVCLLLSWNISNLISKKIKKINSKIKIIRI